MESKQVLDVQQMQHLQELGLDTSNASAEYYRMSKKMDWFLVFGCRSKEELLDTEENISAYTLQDVLDALPKSLKIGKSKYEISIYMIEGKWAVDYYSETDADIQSLECENLIDAVYSRLCWAIEHKFVETNKNE